jgi:anti-sigma B factor antagonist
LTVENYSEATLIAVDETRIDAASAVSFKDTVRKIAQDGPSRIILNLEKVAFIDSSGLGAIVGAMKLLGPDGKMELTTLSPTVEKVFRLTRMDTIFPIHRTVQDAIQDLAPAE